MVDPFAGGLDLSEFNKRLTCIGGQFVALHFHLHWRRLSSQLKFDVDGFGGGIDLDGGHVSVTLAFAPGPVGMLTIIPDLKKVWDIQQQMVADIAACYGKSAQLNQQMMVYCLFRHGAAMLTRDILIRVGERLILKEGSLRVIQKILQRVTIQLTQKTISKSISRWVPIISPIVTGGYSFLDTRSVGNTAIETFSREIEIEVEELR